MEEAKEQDVRRTHQRGSVKRKKVDPASSVSEAVAGIQSIDPHVIYWLLIPLLLYQDASDCHWPAAGNRYLHSL